MARPTSAAATRVGTALRADRMAAGRYRYGLRVRELGYRLRAFGARHEFLSAALFFVVLASAWSWPMFKGDQLTQDYVRYQSVPWKAERPVGLHVTPRSTDGDITTAT